jgi:hypothetical protein
LLIRLFTFGTKGGLAAIYALRFPRTDHPAAPSPTHHVVLRSRALRSSKAGPTLNSPAGYLAS